MLETDPSPCYNYKKQQEDLFMATVNKYEKGTVIFLEGQWELCCYDIISGKVGIYASYGEADETLLTELGAGKFFGEMGVIEYMPRSATAVALEDTEAAVIDDSTIDEYLKNQPEKLIQILQNLSSRLRELSGQYMELCGTVAEFVEAEEAKQPQKSGVLGKIKKIVNFFEKYNASYQEMLTEHPEIVTGSYSPYYMWY